MSRIINKFYYIFNIFRLFYEFKCFCFSLAVYADNQFPMKRKSVDEQTMIKKGEAGRLLGFGNTAAYRYLDFLTHHKIISPVFLPGIKTPRYIREEVLAIADREPAGIPEFKVINKRKVKEYVDSN